MQEDYPKDVTPDDVETKIVEPGDVSTAGATGENTPASPDEPLGQVPDPDPAPTDPTGQPLVTETPHDTGPGPVAEPVHPDEENDDELVRPDPEAVVAPDAHPADLVDEAYNDLGRGPEEGPDPEDGPPARTPA